MSKNLKLSSKKLPNSIISGFLQFLASTYSLYLKTQNFHWNVTGPNFFTLHSFFEQQYNELADAVDLIAERIRALGTTAPGSFFEFSKLSNIKDAIGKRSAQKMINELLNDHLSIIKLTKELINISLEINDLVSQDLLINRLKFHEKTIWMLRSFK